MKFGALVALVVAVAVSAGVVVSCSGSNHADDKPSTSRTTEADDTATSADGEPSDREQAVVRAYEEASQARTDAMAPPAPDPDDPGLAETHTGPMLEQTREVASGLLAQGRAIRYPEDSRRRIDVESVEFRGDDVAILHVCAVDDGERIVVETGEVLAEGVFTARITAAMQLVDDHWKLAESRIEDEQEGVTGCAAG